MRDEAPKSAYELAMERLRKKDREEGVEEKPLTDAQKAEIAEARRVAEAQMAEKEIFHRSALARAADPESAAALEDDYRRERERIASRRDEAIAAIRARG